MNSVIGPMRSACATSASVSVSGSAGPCATTTVSPARMNRARSSAAASRVSGMGAAEGSASALDHAFGMQALEFGLAVAQLARDLVGVLTELGRAELGLRRFARELDRHTQVLAAVA